jgi:hypothetical protein
MSGTASATKRSRFMGHRVQLVVPTKYYPDFRTLRRCPKNFLKFKTAVVAHINANLS